MATGYRIVEHWASGEPFTADRRDLWLLAPDDIWAARWAVEYRRGGLGKPIERRTFDDEDAARWGLAAWMEQCANEAAGADWVQA